MASAPPDDFRENFCSVQRVDGAGDILHGTAANLSRGSLAASLVIVRGGRLRVFQGQGETVIDAPLAEVAVGPRRKATPTAVTIDAGGHRWMVNFAYVHKAGQRGGGIGQSLASLSAIGNLKSMRVGSRLRDQFVGVLLTQGASER